MGLERAHTQCLSEGELLPIVGFGLLALRSTPHHTISPRRHRAYAWYPCSGTEESELLVQVHAILLDPLLHDFPLRQPRDGHPGEGGHAAPSGRAL